MARRKKLVIRKTVNLTDNMRKERQQECFEEMSTAVSIDAATSLSHRKRRKIMSKRAVKILKEKVVDYDADLVSAYDKTNDTHSMGTISEQENVDEFEKNCQEYTYIGPQITPMKFVTTDVETPVQAVFVSDFDLCEEMHLPGPGSTQYKRVEFSKRFEMELKFLEELVIDIEKLLASSGRLDVELTVVKTREKNGMPRCKICLVRRMKKADTKLTGQHGLVGFDPPPPETKDDEFAKNHVRREEISKNQQVPSVPVMYEKFKNLFGF